MAETAAKVPDPFDLSAGVPPVEGELTPKPKVALGMSRKVMGVVMLGALALLVVLFTGIANVDDGQGGAQQSKKEEEKPRDEQLVNGLPKELAAPRLGSAASVEAVTMDVASPGSGTGGAVPGSAGVAPNSVLAGGVGGGKVPAPIAGGVPAAPVQAAQLSPEAQRAAQRQLEREQRLMSANLTGLESRPYQSESRSMAGLNEGAAGAVKPAAPTAMSGLFGHAGPAGGRRDEVSSDQDEKVAFLKSAGGANGAAVAGNGYHEHTVVPPLSDRQLNAGALIPAILEMAVNSDLPGQVTARVRENVFASINENCMLLPSGAQLIGTYSSKVALGQARQLVVWNRVFFPNGHELNLAGMSSADVSGQAGLDADVDNHFFRLFGVALGMSMVTAGVQLSVGTPPVAASGAVAAPTTAQVVSTALAQQFGQLGGQLFGRYLNVQPTLRNFPGERFNVVVPKSIVFPRCYSR